MLLITKSSLFNFDDSEIFEFHSQLGQLIDNLSNVYRMPPIQGNLDDITIDYDGNTYGSPSQLTTHVEPSLDELKVAAKVESPMAEVQVADKFESTPRRSKRGKLKASSNSSINVVVPSGDSAAESYILTQFTQEYLSQNDVSLNDLSKEEILILTSTPVRMEEEVAQEPLMSGFDETQPIQEESADELQPIQEEPAVAQEPLQSGFDDSQQILEESVVAQEPGFDDSHQILEESVVAQEPGFNELHRILEESAAAQKVIVSLPLQTDFVVLESHQTVLLDTHNAALVTNIASSKKGRVTNATLKKHKSSLVGSVAPPSNDANSPSSKGGVTKPLVKKRKINEAQQSNEANATSNKETGKASKKKSVGKLTGRSPASNLAKASKKESAPQRRTRQGKAVAINTTVDPFLGKGVAFRCNSDFGRTLIKEFGKKWVPNAVCYHLDGKARHVVGTVMTKSRGLGKRNGNKTNYSVVWEFSALGETNVPYSYFLEGNKEADRLMICRKK